MEISADGGVKSDYCGSGLVTGTWTAINNGATMLISYPSPPAPYYFSQMQNIAGSTSSGTFTGNFVGNDGNTGPCTWFLTAGAL